MTKYSFILLNGEQDALLEQLQEIGLVDIVRDYRALDAKGQELKTGIELMDGLIKGLKSIEIPQGTTPAHIDVDIERLAGGMLMRYTEELEEFKDLQQQKDESMKWGDMDLDTMVQLEQAGVPFHFHIVPSKQFNPQWENDYILTVVYKDKSDTYFVVVGEDGLPGEEPRPQKSADELVKELREKEQRYDLLFQHMAGAKERIPELETRKKEYFLSLDRHLASGTAAFAAEDTLVTLVGYAPTEEEEKISAALDQSGFFYIKENAMVNDNPPISLRNNWFVRQFETLTDMYGRPAYDGFDPTPFISVFFLLFFAFCMGDCGYGLVLIVIGLLLGKSEGFKSLAPLVTILGVGTVVIGFFFHTFFSIDIAEWEIFQPVKGIFLPAKIAGYDGTMVLALVVGVIHICLALCVKTYQETKNKGLSGALGTWGWTLLIVGGVIVGAMALAGVLSSETTKWVVIVLGIVSALGIFVFNDPHRSKLANVGVGLWNTYNTATGLLGDVLSYLRLYALGLAGAMLGMAFNNIGAMVLGDGSNVLLWIPFLLIVLIGHTLNVAMCALGAFVHPLRLNFLEFFKNSGYEANGRNYNPLSK